MVNYSLVRFTVYQMMHEYRFVFFGVMPPRIAVMVKMPSYPRDLRKIFVVNQGKLSLSTVTKKRNSFHFFFSILALGSLPAFIEA